MKDYLEPVERAFSYAAVCLTDGPDGDVDDARVAMQAALDYLGVLHPQELGEYNPYSFFRQREDELSDETHSIHLEPVSDCLGDPDKVWLCVRLLARSAELAGDAMLAVELFEEDGAPVVALSFDGPGTFPLDVPVAGSMRIPRAEFEARWTAVTRGGRIDKGPNGLIMRLTGLRQPPERLEDIPQFFAWTENVLRSLAQDGLDTKRAQESVAKVLSLLDDEQPAEACDIVRLLDETLERHAITGAVVLEKSWEAAPPPLAMRRDRVYTAWRSVLSLMEYDMPKGGTAETMTDYDRETHEFSVLVVFHGTVEYDREPFELASIRRAIKQHHGGRVEWERSDLTTNLTLVVPDAIGQRVEQWLPGFGRFSEKARQMLRLLKSGGQAPPAEFILPGVLEDELQRWLLPRLETPAAVNAAHGIKGSGDMLNKALEQIRRGKPKKEISRPAYAGALLEAYGGTLKSLGVDESQTERVGRLAELLQREPLDGLESLRVLAGLIAAIK